MNRAFVTTRRRSWWKRVLIWLLLAVVTTAIGRYIEYEIDRARGEKELAAAIAETEALDPRWRWHEIEEDRPQVADDRNSVRVILELGRSQRDWDKTALFRLDGKDAPDGPPPNHRLSDERANAVRSALADLGDGVNAARSLKDYPGGRAAMVIADNPLDTKMEHVQYCRTAARILQHDVERRLLDQDPIGAMEDVCATLYAGSPLRGEPTLISQLVRIAILSIAIAEMERILGVVSLPADALKQAQERFSDEEREELTRTGLRGDRAMFSLLYDHMKSGRMGIKQLSGGPVRDEDWEEILSFKLYRSRLDQDHAMFLRAMNALSQILELPVWERRPLLRDFEREFRAATVKAKEEKRNILAHLLLPAFNKVADAEHRVKAMVGCTVAAIAAERYRLANGRWPNGLDALVPEFLAQMPLDPFDGQPLRLAARDNGITIYSIGPNEADDGGQQLTRSGTEPNSDLGFRLFDPDARGLPAP